MTENVVLNAFAFLENGTLTNGNTNSPTQKSALKLYKLSSGLRNSLSSLTEFQGSQILENYDSMVRIHRPHESDSLTFQS
jgi:hypothetical protein